MPYDPTLSSQPGSGTRSYRVARGVMELFVDSDAADRRLSRFFTDTERGMSQSAQRASRMFVHGFTQGVDGAIRDRQGNLIDPNDPRLRLNSTTVGRRFARWFSQSFHDNSQSAFNRILPDMFQNLPPQVQAGIAGGIVAAIYAGSAFIGAALNAVLLAALGGAGLAAGIASAFQDQRVQDAFGRFPSLLRTMWSDFGTPFIQPLVKSVDDLFARLFLIQPQLREMAATLSVLVQPLVDGIAGFVEELLPGLQKGLEGSLPVLEALFRDLPMLGASIGSMFESLGEGSEGAAEAMHLLMGALSGTFEVLGDAIQYLSEEWDEFTDNVSTTMNFLAGLPLIGGFFEEWAETWNSINRAGEGGFVRVLGETATGMDDVARSTKSASEQAQELKRSWDELWGKAMTLDEALIRYEESVDKLTDSLKENGRTLDIGTEAGRSNARALLDVAEKAKAVRDAEVAAGVSVDVANRKLQAQVEELRRNAYQAGLNKQQVDALLQKYYEYARAPNLTKTTTVKTIYITSGQPPRAAPGVRYYERWGGIVHARDGLVNDAAFYPAGEKPLVMFAEPETGGEAYIPRRGNRDRSLGILKVAADWNNADVVPRDAGAPGMSWGATGHGRFSRAIRGQAGPPRAYGPYVIQLGDQVVGQLVIDAITGQPQEVAAAVNEGNRRNGFLNQGRI